MFASKLAQPGMQGRSHGRRTRWQLEAGTTGQPMSVNDPKEPQALALGIFAGDEPVKTRGRHSM
jgi:hypothetical protein